MGIFKRKSNVIFLSIILILAAALSAVSYIAFDKHKEYTTISTSLSDNTAALEEAQELIDNLNQQIAEFYSQSEKNEKEKAELDSKLQAALEEKAKLEQENVDLKNQLKELSERKELESQIALSKVNQADTMQSGVCYLTFDDGPSDNTLKILNILDSYNIEATFFVVGTSKTQYLPQIAARGHAIGLHSTTHKYEDVYSNINNYLKDIKQISDIVYNKTGVRSNIIRFPGGSSNVISAQYCPGIMTDLTQRMQELGYSYYDWNVVSGDADAARVPANTIVTNVLNRAKGKKSICVLMHDNGGKDTTVAALPRIIEGLSAMGFRFEPITADVFGFHQNVIN